MHLTNKSKNNQDTTAGYCDIKSKAYSNKSYSAKNIFSYGVQIKVGKIQGQLVEFFMLVDSTWGKLTWYEVS